MSMSPVGLPNINNSCWLNSLLQLMVHSPHIQICIRETDQTPLHSILNPLFNSMLNHDLQSVLHHYQHCYQQIIQMHPVFAQSSLNDSHEVLIYFLNALHDETKVLMPPDVIQSVRDPGSISILRDYNNYLSSVLETCLSCVTRKTRDGTVITESFMICFIEPSKLPDGTYSIQKTITDMVFVNTPKTLILSLILSEECSCRLPQTITIGKRLFALNSIIFFLPSLLHYICAVRAKNSDGWFIMDDTRATYVDNNEIGNVVRAYPSIITYEYIQDV